MSQSARRLYRHTWMKLAYWGAAVVWAINTVLNVVWFGELSMLNIALPILWALLAVLYSRPYAVVDHAGITLAIAPLRPTTLSWDQIVSYEEPKPGIAKIALATGKTLTVRIKDVRPDDQGVLRAVLQGRRFDSAEAALEQVL